jgi:hypothetical protein
LDGLFVLNVASVLSAVAAIVHMIRIDPAMVLTR